MKNYNVQLGCGCCSAVLKFENDEAIQKAFDEAGLSSSATITDATGETVESVDTFYGFRECDENGNYEDEENDSSLGRLFNNIFKKD